jgi:hypothetical protein
MFEPWFNWGSFVVESTTVVWLRMIKLAQGGPEADEEARLMVSEKITAATQATAHLIAGKSPECVAKSYRRKVRANARRLSKRGERSDP